MPHEQNQDGDESWFSWRRALIREQERQAKALLALSETVNGNAIELAMVKIKCSLWGAAGGALSVAAVAGIRLISGKGGPAILLKILMWAITIGR